MGGNRHASRLLTANYTPMYHYNVHLRAKNHEFCGGQNTASSRKYLLWINKRKSKGQAFEEFAYSIGYADNKTNKIWLETPTYPKELQPQVDEFLKIIRSIFS